MCFRRSGLCFDVAKKRRHWFAVFIIFSSVSNLQSILEVRTARIIIKGSKPAWHFQQIYWLRKHKNLLNWGEKVIYKLQHQHSDIWHTGINKINLFKKVGFHSCEGCSCNYCWNVHNGVKCVLHIFAYSQYKP